LRAQAPRAVTPQPEPKKELVGIDVYVEWPGRSVSELGQRLQELNGDGLSLRMISNRGVTVWPSGVAETFCTDIFDCRFQGGGLRPAQVLSLLQRLADAGVEVVKTEYLRNFDGQPGFSLAQGE
jgi:isocitrate dehydrogenase